MFESEERQIVRRIKDFISNNISSGRRIKKFIVARYIESTSTYLMLRNGRILGFADYPKMLSVGKIKPQDVYVYIGTSCSMSKATFYYPFLKFYDELFHAYLSKLGFDYDYSVVPATGLKYVAAAVGYEKRYLSVEVVNLDTAVNNTNLPKIVAEVLGEKLISGEKELTDEEYEKIYNTFRSQRLFAGHSVEEAEIIIDNYYTFGSESHAKEVARIAMDYYRIFNPYRVCYDMNNWKEVDCWSIKL